MNEATKLYSYDGILPFFFFWYLLELIELLLMLQSLLQVSSVSQEVFPESRDQSFFCPQSPVSLSVTVPHPSSVCSLIASGVFQEPPVARPASPQWAEAGRSAHIGDWGGVCPAGVRCAGPGLGLAKAQCTSPWRRLWYQDLGDQKEAALCKGRRERGPSRAAKCRGLEVGRSEGKLMTPRARAGGERRGHGA